MATDGFPPPPDPIDTDPPPPPDWKAIWKWVHHWQAPILGIALALIYIRQSGTMTAQLSEMTAQRKDSEALQAPILQGIDPEMWPYDSNNNTIAKTDPNIAGWLISPGIKNVGTTRAVHFRMGSKVDPEPLIGGFPDEKDWKKACPTYTEIGDAKDNSKDGFEATLPPGDTNGRIAPAERLGLDKAILNAKHQYSIVFIVYATYQDIFDTKTWHHFYRCEWIVANNLKTSEFSKFVVDEKSD